MFAPNQISLDDLPAGPGSRIVRAAEVDVWQDGYRFLAAVREAAGKVEENARSTYAAAYAKGYAEGRAAGAIEASRLVRDTTLALYTFAAEHARPRGILIADTKFEFGLDDANEVVWIDEALTPDSSRFWDAATYRTGISPPSYDKQFVRDWLETTGWDKNPPAPELPADVVARTREKYVDAFRVLTGADPEL